MQTNQISANTEVSVSIVTQFLYAKRSWAPICFKQPERNVGMKNHTTFVLYAWRIYVSRHFDTLERASSCMQFTSMKIWIYIKVGSRNNLVLIPQTIHSLAVSVEAYCIALTSNIFHCRVAHGICLPINEFFQVSSATKSNNSSTQSDIDDYIARFARVPGLDDQIPLSVWGCNV